MDCDGDVILLKIEQVGGIACHTGRKSCFFNRLHGETGWVEVVLYERPGRDLSKTVVTQRGAK